MVNDKNSILNGWAKDGLFNQHYRNKRVTILCVELEEGWVMIASNITIFIPNIGNRPNN